MASSEEESEVDWEDVEENDDFEPFTLQKGHVAGNIERKPSSLQITVDQNASLVKKGQKKSTLQLLLEKRDREIRQNSHKVHILCLLSNGFVLNAECNDDLLQSLLLSLIPTASFRFVHLVESLSELVRWFAANCESVMERLREEATDLSPAQHANPVLLLVAMLRSCGLRTRLVLALNPMPFKKQAAKKAKVSGKGKEKKSSTPTSQRTPSQDAPVEHCRNGTSPTHPGMGQGSFIQSFAHSAKPARGRSKRQRVENTDSSDDDEEEEEVVSRSYSKRRRSSRLASASSDCQPVSSKSQHFTANPVNGSDSDFEPQSGSLAGKLKRKRQQASSGSCSLAKKLKAKRQDTLGTTGSDSRGGRHFTASVVNTIPTGAGMSSPSLGTTVATNLRAALPQAENEAKSHSLKSPSASAIYENPTSPALPLPTPTQDRDDEVKQQLYNPTNSWAEVFDAKAGKWCCVHLSSRTVGDPRQADLDSPAPLLYVWAFDAEGCVRDVTPRYATTWCTMERKGRVAEEWVRTTLAPYALPEEDEERENDNIVSLLLSRPMPARKQALRGHPLYALRSHLLKYEAVYPESSQILGYCESEAVFSRGCVHTLHGRESWLKEARVVRKGEQPFKVVKSYGIKKCFGDPSSDRETPLFGEWQTEEYVPPPIVDGKVPRNEFGNIEVFKPSMVPRGGCHIVIPGIQKVAKRLGIDCASAVVGWEFHGRYSFPLIQGIVVAEENRELLVEANHAQEQKNEDDRRLKKEKAVLARWTRFVKGIIIAQRVKRRFDSV